MPGPATSPPTADAPPPVLPAVARGASGATATCIDRYGPLVWGVARRLCRDRQDAEDAVQDVFIELWRKAGDFDPARGSEPAFVATLARRRMIDLLRKRGRRPECSPLGAVADEPTSGVELDDEAAAAREAVATLSQPQRRVLDLHVYEGLSQREIAERLTLPLGTVKAHARRGLQAVRDALARRAESARQRRQRWRQE